MWWREKTKEALITAGDVGTIVLFVATVVVIIALLSGRLDTWIHKSQCRALVSPPYEAQR